MQVVKIMLFESQCSGIIISCSNFKKDSYSNYVIITVAHLSKDLFEKIEENKLQNNIKSYICFDIFNTEKTLISKNDYEIEDYFVSSSLLNEDDILCFYVKVKDRHRIDGKVKISNSDYFGGVLTEGFPNISNSQIIELKGSICKKTDEADYVSSYRISDDYHYYESISDLRIMEGLSGAPILNENSELLGINQSIPYFSNGENPFKIVNYIAIYHIFNHLRENNCIVYSLIDDNIKLKWIKNYSETKKEISALVIGGSGAGKSSFISQFIYDNDIIDSSGDGQTTRSDVIYNLSAKNGGRKAKVFLLNNNDSKSKDENHSFPLARFNNINLELIIFIFKYRYGIPEYDIFSDNYIYFKKIYSLLNVIIKKEEKDSALKENIEKTITEISKYILSEHEKDNNELYERYIDIFVLLDKIKIEIDYRIFKIVINNNLIMNLLEQHEYAKVISDEDERCMRNFNRSSKNIDNFDELLKEIYFYLNDNITDWESVFGEKAKNIINKYDFSDELYDKELNEILRCQKGNFEIDEFKFLDKENKLINLAEISKSELKSIKDIIKNNTNNEKKDFESIETNVKKIYNNIYQEIQRKLVDFFEKNSYLGVSVKYDEKTKVKEIEFDFNYLTDEGVDLLKYCLKVHYVSADEKKSLTAIIDKVEIYDMLSNDYAYLADELDLKSIIFHDTRGLDHIEKGVDKKMQLRNYLTNLEEGKSRKKRIDAVFYIKKLDSGRPTELENTIPFIYEIIPNVPFFCLFTGIDILGYKKNSVIDWYKETDIRPNSVKYLFSRDIDKVFETLSFSQNRKNSIKESLQKNIGAFCAVDNYKNNLLSIKKIIKSILMKEIDSIDIIEQTTIDKLSDDEGKKEIKKLLFIFFSRCVINWKYAHWKTAKANAERIHKGYVLGYWGTYRHRWDLIFNDAYVDIFKDSIYTSNFLNLFHNNSEKIEAALISVQKDFLGESSKIYTYNDENEFIKILKKLYINNETCPFNSANEGINFNSLDTYDAKNYLDKIQNFPKLMESNSEVLDEFSDLLIDKLRKYLEEDRKDSIKNIIRYNEIISSSGCELINEVANLFKNNVEKDNKLNIIRIILESMQK